MHEKNNLDTVIMGRQDVVSSQCYRNAMSCCATAVHIITTAGSAGWRGMTVSACCSLSDKPPTLLTCILKQNEANRLFLENGHFCINTLAGSHQPLAEIFAGRCGLNQKERFAKTGWTRMKTGSPVLENALASFDCRLVCWYDHATHYILYGQIVGISCSDSENALVYLNRGYHHLAL
ncbi:MAG: Flavin reductase family protein [Candidatus Tokpelaia sp. JSC085]|nr:MAG: Flavin reductase family protein [Candidatus Tokpelaia sp. JSC085]